MCQKALIEDAQSNCTDACCQPFPKGTSASATVASRREINTTSSAAVAKAPFLALAQIPKNSSYLWYPMATIGSP